MADIEVATLLAAEENNLSLKRGFEGLFLKYKTAALGVLNHQRTLLPFFLSPPTSARNRGGGKKTPQA